MRKTVLDLGSTSLGGKGNGKDTSMKGNGKMGKNTVKEHGLGLMDKKM